MRPIAGIVVALTFWNSCPIVNESDRKKDDSRGSFQAQLVLTDAGNKDATFSSHLSINGAATAVNLASLDNIVIGIQPNAQTASAVGTFTPAGWSTGAQQLSLRVFDDHNALLPGVNPVKFFSQPIGCSKTPILISNTGLSFPISNFAAAAVAEIVVEPAEYEICPPPGVQ
jgi:hypothetical protein